MTAEAFKEAWEGVAVFKWSRCRVLTSSAEQVEQDLNSVVK
ncbi:MAG: hypothetical protein ABI488_06050 [Polyangiaceae bacterium]